MIFTQHYLECLSHASYLLGDESTGRAVVVDPRRDVDVYLEEAEACRLTIERVIETHVHADFLSGHLELAARTGAVISYGELAEVGFPIDPLRDGQRLSLGQVTLEVLATPGHTPESICIVIYEHPDDDVPFGVLTGDTLFVGGVGRPDLVAAGDDDVTTDLLARRLYHSVHHKLLALPDATRVFPAHGAGSSCGKQLAAETSSTLGEQRQLNDALRPMTEDEFVATVTEGQPLQPRYFGYDARRNRELRPLLADEPPPLLDVDAVLWLQAAGVALLDTSEEDAFAGGHLRQAFNVGLMGRFAERVGSVVAPDRDIVLVGDAASAGEAAMRLGRIGYDRVVGQLDEHARSARPDLFEPSHRLSVDQLGELLASAPELQLIDVRNPSETADGMLPGARAIPLPALTSSLTTIDPKLPVVLYCASGQRSLTAASVLIAAGCEDVADLVGGFDAWERAGREITLCPLTVHRTNPLNSETSLAAHDGGLLTPEGMFYVRNHFAVPTVDASWRLRVGGLVERPMLLDLDELQAMDPTTLLATLECAGNGRSTLRPRTDGEQWQTGAVSTAEWTGVLLVDVLDRARVTSEASALVMRGADSGCVDGSREVIRFERSLSVGDACRSGAVLAYAMNGAPLPLDHGYPLRLVVPGWYGVASVKWLNEIEAISGAFEGYFQTDRYVLEIERDGFVIREPVGLQRIRSLIVAPVDEQEVAAGELAVRGLAWSGAAPIAGVDVAVGDGPWQTARLHGDGSSQVWQWWDVHTRVEGRGPITIRARATDLVGNVQPDEPEWNRLGYGANGIHTVHVHRR